VKAIVGVDGHGIYKPAIQLLARFRFAITETTMAHFVSVTPPYVPMEAGESGLVQAEYMKVMENAGRTALDFAREEACMRDLKPKSTLRMGNPGSGLGELADQLKADLVAVRAERGSLWATSFLGSVSRGLAIGSHASILVAKEPVREAIPLKVVLATDHSEASQRWIERFISWQPKGISEIHVVTAYQLNSEQARVLKASIPTLDGMVEAWIEEHLLRQNERLVEKLTAAGFKATSRVGSGRPNDVIRQAMQDTQADVLVMGAQGHGFVERLFVGSCAMHQVLSEPYPVLVVRS